MILLISDCQAHVAWTLNLVCETAGT